MENTQFKSLNSHIVEYYQLGKYLGHEIRIGEVHQSEIGYSNATFIKEGKIKFKRIYIASEQNPFRLVKYNLQGRVIK